MTHHTLIIIGSGPAGDTAALYAARADLAPLVIEGPQPGGQLTITSEVENFPGFPDGIEGPELMGKMRAQAERFGATYQFGWVESVDLASSPKKLTLEGGDSLTADAVIIATGATARLLGLEGESVNGQLLSGVSACATCDAAFYRDKKVIVVGGGDTAMEEAMFLTKFASHVDVLVRRDALRASKPMQQRAVANEKITLRWNRSISAYLTEEVSMFGGMKRKQLSGVRIKDTLSGDEVEEPIDGVFMAIGHVPNTTFLAGAMATNDEGYLLRHANSSRTDLAGVFVCGDVCDHEYRQAITAAGSGCMAAMDAERWLAEA